MSAVMAPTVGRLIDPTLFFEDGSGVRLAGSRCDDCSAVTFPAQRSCPRCTGEHVQRHPLPDTGRIWAFTVQRFTPKTPYLKADSGSAPFAVGYVELGGEVLVESRLLVDEVASLRIGAPARLALEQLPGANDEPIWTFAFAVEREEDAA